MGVKFLSLRMVAWTCFQLKSNSVECGQVQPEPPAAPRTIKLIDSNGSVKIYTRPIHAAELMVQFPKHLICRSDSFYIGQKIPALADSDLLQFGHNYFLLPTQFFQSVLSFVNIAAFASAKSTPDQPFPNALMKKAVTCRPFDIQKSPSGILRIRVTDEFISQLMEKGDEAENGEAGCEGEATNCGVCNTPQLKRDYKQLVRCRQWKPELETIGEIKEKRELSSFGMKRSKKSQAKVSQKTQQRSENPNITRSSTSSKACKAPLKGGKIKIIRSKK